MDERAQAIADLLRTGPRGLQQLIAHFHGPGHPKRSPGYRDIDWALQRLQRRDAVYYAGRKWHYGSQPAKLGDVTVEIEPGQSVTFSASWLDRYEPEPNTGCWLWTGPWGRRDYGIIKANSTYAATAHRAFYAHHISPIPDGLLVCHRCDTPACVNPAHMFLGTDQDNSDDKIRKGRDNRYSKLTVESVLAIRKDQRPLKEVARDYGVSPMTISSIRNRSRWAHLEDANEQ